MPENACLHTKWVWQNVRKQRIMVRRHHYLTMKRLLLIFLVLGCSLLAFAQEKPLTQAEYVKLLYALEAAPARKQDVVDALRKRGIEFVVSDGLRSLTRSKGANDEELKRALEEADRRRQNPTGAALPAPNELRELLANTTTKTLEAVSDMPDFVVKQQIQRSAAYEGTGNFRNLDNLIVAVSYRSTGEESYRLLSVNGALQNSTQAKDSYNEVGGTSSTGEFVTMLATIFKPESRTRFEPLTMDVVRGRRTVVFEFHVDKDLAKQVVSAVGSIVSTTITGIKGRIWIDRDDARVLKIESEATDIPANFPIRSASRDIDYDWVKIENERYLLPSLSDVRVIAHGSPKALETRNLIRFKNYQKYGSEVRILDDDIKPEPEPTPIKPD